jgi:hypothetical protein
MPIKQHPIVGEVNRQRADFSILQKCLTAFNEMPNRKIKSLDNYSTYELAAEIQRHLDTPEPVSVGGWCIADVKEYALEHENVQLTDQQADEILVGIGYSFDATIGINWDVIAQHIDNYLDGETQEPTGETDDDNETIWRIKI